MWIQMRVDLMPQVDATSVLLSNSKVSVQKNVNYFSYCKVIIYKYLNYFAIVI